MGREPHGGDVGHLLRGHPFFFQAGPQTHGLFFLEIPGRDREGNLSCRVGFPDLPDLIVPAPADLPPGQRFTVVIGGLDGAGQVLAAEDDTRVHLHRQPHPLQLVFLHIEGPLERHPGVRRSRSDPALLPGAA